MTTLTLPARVAAFERRYRADHTREHALLLAPDNRLIAEYAGDQDSVTFAPADLERARGGLVSHTHPRGLPPSFEDLALAAQYDLTLRAVGNAPDTGQQLDHTLKPSLALDLMALERAFDNAVEQAEQELAALPYGDLQWQRESRHLALTRLSAQYDFFYQRVERRPLSEATQGHHEQARLDTFAAVETEMRDQVFAPLARAISHDLLRLSRGGTVPISSLDTVRQRLARHVQHTMLGQPLRDGTLTPYTLARDSAPVPRSPYFKTLYGMMRRAAEVSVNRHADLMRKYLPPDLIQAMAYATLNPFEVALHEARGPQYDPLHLWLGDDGKRLSDRIWQATGDMRAKLDAYLTEAIARRLPVDQIAAGLEEYLVEGAGSYEAMRLARTEVAAAAARADSAAGQGNPFVESYTPFTSPIHKCCDYCDTVVQGAPYPKADLTHLPPYHPQCLCGFVWNLVSNIPAVLAALRQQIEQAIANAKRSFLDFIGPLSKRFVDLLFRGGNQE